MQTEWLVQRLSPSADKLAVNLLNVLFGLEELVTGIFTAQKRSDIHLLDQKICAIRRESNFLLV